MLYIYSYNQNSEGANSLRNALGIRKIRHQGSTFQGGPRHTVINWGSSECPPAVMRSNVLNPPERVRAVSNKLHFFQRVSQNAPTILPPWTTDFNAAVAWCAEGSVVCARTVLTGHSANGLVLMDRSDPTAFVRAPLYTKYIKKDEEYRVHIINNTVVAIQRKVLRREKAESGEIINWKVRNLDNGFVFQRNNINPAPIVERVSLEAMRVSGLTFGAVDVICKLKGVREPQAYVLEINSAPGLEGQTITDYANAFRRYM